MPRCPRSLKLIIQVLVYKQIRQSIQVKNTTSPTALYVCISQYALITASQYGLSY